jgi:hypothetical protein
MFDDSFLLFVLPVEGVGLVLVMQIIDTFICSDIIGDLLSLSIIDLFHFS